MEGWLPWPSSGLFWLTWVLRTHKKGKVLIEPLVCGLDSAAFL